MYLAGIAWLVPKALQALEDRANAPRELRELLAHIDRGQRCLELAARSGYQPEQCHVLALKLEEAADLYKEVKQSKAEAAEWRPGARLGAEQLAWTFGRYTARMQQLQNAINEEISEIFSCPAEVASTSCARICFWWTCLLLALGASAFLLQAAVATGDATRLLDVHDWQGQRCGVDPAVAYQPYAYICRGGGPGVGLDDPAICVAACPGSDGQGAVLAGQAACPYGTAAAYASSPLAGKLCMPTEPTVASTLVVSTWRYPLFRVFVSLQEVQHAWQSLAISGVVAALLSLAFLYALYKDAVPVVQASVVLCIGVLAALGFALIYMSVAQGEGGQLGTGDSALACALGVMVCAASALLAFMARSWQSDLPLAILCLDAGCECVADLPALFLAAALDMAFKVAFLCCWLAGLVQLLCCWEQRVLDPSRVADSDPWWRQNIRLSIGLYCGTGLWVLELLHAAAVCAMASLTKRWFYAAFEPLGQRKSVPGITLCDSYATVLRYQLTELLPGSLAVCALRPARAAAVSLAALARALGPGAAGALAACTLDAERMLRPFGKPAYIDLAITSSQFLQAARHSVQMLADESDEALVLDGATWMVQTAGFAAIVASGMALTYFLGVALDSGLQCATAPSLASAVLCGVVASPFLTVVDNVADTILFCIAADATRRREVVEASKAPDSREQRIANALGNPCIDAEVVSEVEKGLYNLQPPATRKLMDAVTTAYGAYRNIRAIEAEDATDAG